MAGVSASITGAAGWKAKFPSFQTPEEFGKEFLEMIVPGLSEAGMTEGIAIIAGLLNSGSTQGDVLTASSNFLSDASVTDAAFGDYAAKFQNQAAVAEFHTVTQEKDTPLSVDNITSDAATVTAAKGDIDGSTVANAAAAAATAAAAAAATAAADAAAAATTASTEAAAATVTAIAAAVTAEATVVTAKAASEAAATKAALTDATALTAATTTASAADVAAQATLTAASTAYDTAITGGDAATVSLANGTKLIAAAAAATTAAALATAKAASDAATADDTAATTAAAALATASEASVTASAAADAAAAAPTTAAAATADTADDAVAATQVAAAAASNPTGDAIAATAAAAAAIVTSTAAGAAADTAVAASATANATATAAIAAVSTNAQAASALVSANAAVAAATAATTAIAAYTTAAAVTVDAADDTAAAALAVTGATQATAAAAAVTSATASVAVERKVYSLTSTQDTLAAPDSNDTITGALVKNGAAGSTAQPGDSITGGAGTDKFSLSVSGDAGGAYALEAVSLSGVEIFHVNNFETDAGATTINTALMTGLTEVGLASSNATGDTVFSNVANIVDMVVTNGSGDFTVGYTAGASTGANVQNIAISNATGTITAAGVETVNLSAGIVKSTLADLVIDNANLLNITGSTDLKITATVDMKNTTSTTAGAIDNTVDASTFTGKLTYTPGALAGENVSITGGTGNDTINLGAGLNGYDKIVGGAGADKITMNAATLGTQFAQVSGVETIQFNDSGAAVAVNASKLPADTTSIVMILKDDVAGSDNLLSSVTNHTTQAITITRADEDADVNGQVDVTITGVADTTADTVTVNLLAIGLQGDEASDTDGDENGMGILNVGNYETINLASSPSTTTFANRAMSLVATVATDVNVTGSAALTLDGVSGTKITSFDASAHTGALVATFGANKIDLKLGSASSTANFAGNLNYQDTITGGAGTADTVTASMSGFTAVTSAVTMSGVEKLMLTTGGNNTLALAGVTGATTLGLTANTQTITGFDLGTTIELSGAAAVTVTAADATGAADTLKIRQKLNGSVDNTITAVAGIENISVEVYDTGATTNVAGFNLTGFRGTTATFTQSAFSNNAVTVDGAGSTLYKTVDTITATGLKGPFTAAATNATNAVTFNVQGAGIQTLAGGSKADTFTIGSTGAITHAITGNGGADITNITAAAGLVNVGSIDTETINVTIPVAIDNTYSTSFGTGVDYVNVLGGNSLSTVALGAIVTQIKTVNAGGFLGNITATIADDALDSTVTITGGPLITDVVSNSIATAATTYSMKSTGVETLALTNAAAAASTVNTATAIGLGSVVVTQGNTATQTLTIAGLTGAETITLQASDDATAGANEHILVASLADATGSADSIKFKVGSGTVDAGARLQTADIETVSLNANAAADLDLTNLSMTAAGAVMTLNITGTSALTVSGLGTDVTTVDASGMGVGGSVTQGARLSTGAVTYTGSAGADTFIMNNFGDTIVGGAGSDTLIINSAAILGGINVNLGATGNNILSANGSAPLGSASGFTSVDLSGYTGSFGAVVTSTVKGSTITGTGSIDQFTLGALGVDTIKLTSTAAAPATGGVDEIFGFKAGVGGDVIDISSFKGSAFTAADFDEFSNATGAGAIVSNHVTRVEYNGAIAALNFGTAGGANFDALMAGSGKYLVNTDISATSIIAVQGDDETHIYVQADGGAAIDANDITLVAVLNSVTNGTNLVAGNFV
jgi:hypothetical protein